MVYVVTLAGFYPILFSREQMVNRVCVPYW